jgi:hypothetical protein
VPARGPGSGLIAVGAILAFAVDRHMAGVNVDPVGLIMMAVGAIGPAPHVNIFGKRKVVEPMPVMGERSRHCPRV